METLTLEQLAPYLPFDVKGISKELYYNNGSIETIKGLYFSEIITDFDNLPYEYFIILLRPLSDLTKDEETYNELYDKCGGIDENLDYLCEFNGDLIKTNLSYRAVQILIKKKYDVFGLISKNLAIDINQIK